MAPTLAMFPGQGSQYVGMGKSLIENFPYAKAIFEEAEEAAKLKIRQICFEGPESDLTLTANTQPCILTVSVAIWQVLSKETDLARSKDLCFAGHSLGEYSALVASGKMSLADASFLVHFRGTEMQKAVAPGLGAMAAVLKYDEGKLSELCQKCSSPSRIVEIANFNSKDQIVIAGHKSAVEEITRQLQLQDVRCVMLQVSAPFHSSLMKPARDAMAAVLLDDHVKNNGERIVANLTGEIAPDYNIRYLIDQIDHPVRWTQTMETAQKMAISSYIEIGPGNVLFGLARRILPRSPSNPVMLCNTEDLAKTIQILNSTPASSLAN